MSSPDEVWTSRLGTGIGSERKGIVVVIEGIKERWLGYKLELE